MPKKNPIKSNHPGIHVKEQIIPKNLSVKKAAELLGVGRPALSNFLNGNASLSPEMALRLDKTFGANSEELLQLQAKYDQSEMKVHEKDIFTREYVPNFLTIKARDIEAWADGNIEARSLLSVLLRKLVHSTGKELSQVNFPGYDNSERKGWDGEVESGEANPWIPLGKSGWEFGCTVDAKNKADGDFKARVKSVPVAQRAHINFVFVTPRNWKGKDDWVKEKESLGEWKSVKAYDASDLEQWLEQSIPTQGWFAEQANLPCEGVGSLEEYWREWKSPTEPELVPEIFDSSITNNIDKLRSWLKSDPSSQYTITADSREEGLAFLACIFSAKELEKYKDLAIVFTSPEALKKLTSPYSKFIPIIFSEEIEREMGDLYRKNHTIIVRPRNTVEFDPDIALDLLTQEEFEKVLSAMGIPDDQFDLLASESGRSPTILRRRLSKNQAIRTPKWAKDEKIIEYLIPIMLVGTWHTQFPADCEILSVVANCPYEDIEKKIAYLLSFEDCPVWSAGKFRGTVSKIDVLFAVKRAVTLKNIEDFLTAAEYVLSESDPALELPEDQRWAASIYGKTRDHSSILRNGICETLVILSVHGNNLFHERLGVNVEYQVDAFIKRLLTPLTPKKIMSQSKDLPHYAEASPNTFLSLIEEDLQSPDAQIFSLMKPVENGVMGSCPRTGLLWALESLAWKPEQLYRVCSILAKLSKRKLEDNWANKPENSLFSIFRSWIPQTAANLSQRKAVFEKLVKNFPEIGWKLCLDQFDVHSRTGDYNYRPRWRNDASGVGGSVSPKEGEEFSLKAIELALNWPTQTQDTLGDLVTNLQGLPENDHSKVWEMITDWIKTKPNDYDKAKLRERIRRFAFTRRARNKNLEASVKDYAREAYELLTPKDIVIRHQWLFASSWIEESVEESECEDHDFEKREERIYRQRINALQEIWKEKGFAGIKELLPNSESPAIFGEYLARDLLKGSERKQFLKQCLEIEDADSRKKTDKLILGFLFGLSLESRQKLLSALGAKLPNPKILRLFINAPCERGTWELLDSFDSEVAEQYWREVPAYWARVDSSQTNELIEKFLEVGRPRAAFNATHLSLKSVDTTLLKRMLREIATETSEAEGTYPLEAYEISSALEQLQGRPGVSEDEMASLELIYINVLDHTKHTIENLEKQIAKIPALFMHAIALVYKRSDNAEDPPEWSLGESEGRVARNSAHALLKRMCRIPGTDDSGKIDPKALKVWVDEVRSLCSKHGRTEVGDSIIGQLVAKAPKNESGRWPCDAVAELLEEVRSPDINRGFEIGVYNLRGAHWRGKGGGQERVLAESYREWSQSLLSDYPYVANLLEQIAKGYDHEAEWHDTEAMVERRLRS